MERKNIYQSLKDKLFGKKKSYSELLVEKYRPSSASGGFYLPGIKVLDTIYLANCTGVHTYIFSSRLNPQLKASYHNENFHKLMRACAGRICWPDNDRKVLTLEFENAYNERISWKSQMVSIMDTDIHTVDLEYKKREISHVTNLLQKLESFLKNQKGITTPQIVITFDGNFSQKNSYRIINEDISKIEHIDEFPFVDFPYEKSMIKALI
jgi:type III secretory pathway component EscV